MPVRTSRWPRRWWWELALAAGMYWIYEAIRSTLAGSQAWAERNGADLLHWEKVAHLDPERWLNAAVQHLPALAVPACWFYALLYMVVTPGVLIWTYRRRRPAYARARTTLLLVTFAALVGFRWFPAAPPRLLSGAAIQDTMVAYHAWGWWGGNTSAPAGTGTLANPYAAMPSLHVAWSIWCAATVFMLVHRRWVRVLAVAYPIATAVVVLATGNHYLLDAVAGALLWLLAHLAVTGVASWHGRRRRRAKQVPDEPPLPADDVDPEPDREVIAGPARCL